MSALKDEIMGCCSECGGTGYIGTEKCPCSIKFRAFNRLISGGFSKKLLNISNIEGYAFPTIEDDAEFSALEKYVNNPEQVVERGLSLYIFSNEYGRGKTTLAHFIALGVASYFMETENYYKIIAKGVDRSNLFIFRNAQELLEDPEVCFHAPFLVIDDMGNENKSAKWKKENASATFQRVLHAREDKALSTVITSNYNPKALNDLHGRELESLLEITPDGKIHGSKFRQIEVGGGEDLRLVYQDDNWDL